MVTSKNHIQAFTLVETVTALTVSAAVFMGILSIFTILNNKFEAELVRGELVAYCNYALDDVAQSIRLADRITFSSYNNNPVIITSVNDITQNTYALSNDEGILKNGIPIHDEIQMDLENTTAGVSMHKIYYKPERKNGFMKYLLETWKIYPLSENNDNTIYTSENGLILESSFVIELHTKLIMGWDEYKPIKNLQFKRIAFSPGTYLNIL